MLVLYSTQNPLTLMFLIFYLILLVVQVFSMLVHRWLNCMSYFQLENASLYLLFKNNKARKTKSA